MQDRSHSNLLTLLGLFIIVACSCSLFEGIREHVDLIFADDSGYLAYSKSFPQKLRQGYGPGYVLLFKIFGFIYTDPIDVHYNVIIFCSVLTSIGLFLMLRMLKMAAGLSLILAVFLLYSNLNMSFDWWSRISHYSVFFLFLLAGYSSKLKNTTSILALGTFTAFCLSYIRPETFVTFLVLATITILYVIIKGRKELTKTSTTFYVLASLFILLVLFKIGSPMEGGSRLMLAFAQHYTLNVTHWNNQPLTEAMYWQEVFQSTFGEITGLSDLWSNGKEEIIRHFKSNITNYFDQTLKHLLWMIFPEKVFGLSQIAAIVSAAILYILYVVWVGLQDYLEQVISKTKKLLPIFFVLFLFYAPTLASSVIIYPREHYLVLQLAFFFLIFYLLIQPKKPGTEVTNKLNSFPSLLLMGLLLYLIAPSINQYDTKRAWGEYSGIKNVHGIKAVRALDIENETVNLLTATGPMTAYLSDNYNWVVPFNKAESFNTLMDSFDVNMIYVHDILLIDRRYSQDREFVEFLTSYPSKGWIRKEVEGVSNKEHYILVKNELLAN